MQTTNLSYRFITFRPSPTNPSFLTNFLDILLPKIRIKCPAYVVGIEKDGTPERHVHILIGHKSFSDTQKFNQFIFFKEMKDFKASCKDWATIWEHAYHPKEVLKKVEDTLKTIGYILKEENSETEIKGFTEDFIEQSKKFYLANGRVKNNTPSHLRDWKIMTKKNAHNWILDFCIKNNITVRDPLLVYKMKQNAYSFCDLTSKAQKEILDEILIEQNELSETEEQKLQVETINKTYDGQYSIEHTQVDITTDADLRDEVYSLIKKNESLERMRTDDRTTILKLRKEIELLKKKAKPPPEVLA